ncbi:hypothetical protein BJV77DRAFT_350077 [Russula vinacea]|nr:hypothetical protein BJV77DRAFT_350077 [Russula vinacea]
MPTIARSVMTGSVTGALACSAASPVVAFVRTRTDHQLNGRATFKILTDPFLLPSNRRLSDLLVLMRDHSRNKQRLRHLQIHGTPLPGGGEFGILGLKGAMKTRAEARERYGIRGSAFGDCLSMCFCDPCAITQLRREIELEEGSIRNSFHTL